jgi:hypothetical protein
LTCAVRSPSPQRMRLPQGEGDLFLLAVYPVRVDLALWPGDSSKAPLAYRAMALSHLRGLLLHWSHHVFSLSYATIVFAGFAIEKLTTVITIVAFMIIAGMAAALGTVAHNPAQCGRCAKLRPRMVARFKAIEDPQERYEAFQNDHRRYYVSVGVTAVAMMYFIYYLFSLSVAGDRVDVLLIAQILFIVALWWGLHTLVRHHNYYRDMCPLCKRRAARRTYKRLRKELGDPS